MQTQHVGVIGLGPKGRAATRRLLERGFRVTVHDRDAWAVARLVQAGARPARIPADAAEPADLVIVHVPGEAAAEEVLFDCGGVGETLRDGGVVVLASVAGPAFVRSAADRLRALGLRTVEAWFARDARSPVPTVFVGGASADLERVRPALSAVADAVVELGPLGSISALQTAVAALYPLRSNVEGNPIGMLSVAALARAVAGAIVDAGAAGHAPAPAAVVPPPRDGHHRPSVVPRTHLGVLTLEELMDVVDRVSGREPRPRPPSRVAAVALPPDPGHLGLASSEFADLVTELERRCGIPLLPEARRTTSFTELVALVNSQATSGV
jgi:hypothetical protein